MSSLRIILTESQSTEVRQHLDGGAGIAVIGRASYPDQDRLALHVIATNCDRANQAVRVATGEARVSRPRRAKA